MKIKITLKNGEKISLDITDLYLKPELKCFSYIRKDENLPCNFSFDEVKDFYIYEVH